MSKHISGIINSIDAIDDVVQESCDNVYDAMFNEYNKMYQLSYLTESYVQESVGSSIKKGIGFVVGMIKKLINLIVIGFKRLFGFVKNLLSHKKKSQDVNNILEDMNTKTAIEFVTESTTENKRIFYIDIDGDVIKCRPSIFEKNRIKTKYKNITFTSNDFMTQRVARVNLGSLSIVFLKHPEFMRSLKNILNGIHIKDNAVICDPGLFDAYLKLVDDINKKLADVIRNFEHDAPEYINMKNIRVINKDVNEMQKYVNKYFELDHNSQKSDKYIENGSLNLINAKNDNNSRALLDSFNQTLLNINMGINGLVQDIREMYVIDKQYRRSITSPEELDLFIHKMLESNYPSKVIATNITEVVNKSMSGDFRNGMTRIVIVHPSKDYVLKCAMNSSGILGNRTEKNFYDKFKKYGEEDKLAKIMGTYKHDCVIKQEKCKDIGNLSEDEVNEVYTQIDDICDAHNIDMVSDRKPDACGRRISDDKPVLIDYGIISKFSSIVK